MKIRYFIDPEFTGFVWREIGDGGRIECNYRNTDWYLSTHHKDSKKFKNPKYRYKEIDKQELALMF